MPAEPLPLERKLAAILYADVAGYSRLTGQDEEGTHRRLSTYLDLFSAVIRAYHGRVLHYAGDAVLADFATVSEAVSCAAVAQQELAARNQELSSERKVQFRIGVNLGEVIVDRNEIYGDGVNVAARLETLAEPGGICVSGTVYDAVGARLPLTFEFLGEQQVKNIDKPVRAYAARLKPGAVLTKPAASPVPGRWMRHLFVAAAVIFMIAGVTLWLAPWGSKIEAEIVAIPDRPAIAVLPFSNLSGDPGQEYFSDGITNDIITDLSRFSSLFVIASNSVFAYKGGPVKVQEVGRELGVRYVVEGSVQKDNDRVRVNAQLIDATTGHHVWAQRYDRELEDVFSVQEDIVRTIVRSLAVNIDEVERKRVMSKPTDILEAYDYVLRGEEHLSRRSQTTNIAAQKMFAKAIELDPRYAAAYVGLGWTYHNAAGHGWTEFPDRALDAAHDLAQKALALEESADAYRLLGSVRLARGQYELAGQASDRAIELNPNDWSSHAIRASVLFFAGQSAEAIQIYENTLRFDPQLDVDNIFELGLAYYIQSRYGDAIRILEQAVGRTPEHSFLYIALAAAYAQADRPEEAARAAAAVRRLDPFFEAKTFGDRLRNAEQRAAVIQGLVKAGLQ